MKGFALLAMLVFAASPGRGDNRAAIGGIRATHSDRAKIAICQESLDVFKNWRERTGDDIGWRQGGYTFPAYDDAIEGVLKRILPGQQEQGAKQVAKWMEAEGWEVKLADIDPSFVA